MKTAFWISFFSSAAAFVLAMGQTAAVAAERALMVFGCMFLLSALAAAALARIIPSGLKSLLGSGPRVDGKGEDRFVDLEKQTVDLSKLQDMMR